MKCDICSTALIQGNIGYVKVIKKGKSTFLCKGCHNNKRRNKNRKINSNWVIV